MTYRSLLVLLDQDPLCAERTQLAIRLARQFEAHLFGWAPTGLIDLPGSPGAAASMAEFAAIAWDELKFNAEQAVRRFRGDCTAAGLSSFDAEVFQGDSASGLLRETQCHDLALLTQGDASTASQSGVRRLVEQSVLFSARPTLILPYAGRFEGTFKTIMVAWDDSREAAKAIADALPLLHRAAKVHLVNWSDRRGHAPVGEARIERVAAWLRRHRIDVQAHTETTEAPIADAMLSRAMDLDVDLLVMGAYGHSRWTERVLGGATQGLLKSMTVPVLMSH